MSVCLPSDPTKHNSLFLAILVCANHKNNWKNDRKKYTWTRNDLFSFFKIEIDKVTLKKFNKQITDSLVSFRGLSEKQIQQLKVTHSLYHLCDRCQNVLFSVLCYVFCVCFCMCLCCGGVCARTWCVWCGVHVRFSSSPSFLSSPNVLLNRLVLEVFTLTLIHLTR